MKNLFNIIRQQIVKNEVFGKDRKFSFVNNFYPERIIVWMTKQKAFKVCKVTRKPIDNGYQFTIEYKDVCTSCDFLDKAYEALKNNPAEFVITATNARTGRAKYFTKKDLGPSSYEPIMASSSLLPPYAPQEASDLFPLPYTHLYTHIFKFPPQVI